MRKLFVLLALAAMSLSAQQSRAAIVFNLADNDLIPDIASSILINSTDNSHSLTATATAGSSSAFVYRGIFGMGVISGLENPQLDGVGPDETLKFQLDSPLQLESASFTFVGNNDDFTLTVDSTFWGSADIPGGNLFDLDSGTFNFTSSLLTGLLFQFGITETNDDYKLCQLTFLEDENPNEPDPVVPEPASLALVGLGLSAAGVFKRRRKQ